MDRAFQRAKILSDHLLQSNSSQIISTNACLSYSPPELNELYDFDIKEMRKLLDGHNVQDRDWLFNLIVQSKLFNPKKAGEKVFISPDYNQSMEQQREMTMKRISYLLERGVFQGWLTAKGVEAELTKLALLEVVSMFDHSLAIKLGVHFFLWGGAIQFFGTKRHHDKWLRDTENYVVKGCFSMTELGHGSNVRGIETVTTYDSNTGEFVINTLCESAQKYWIGGAANLTVVHKIGLNGVDNGRLWFDNVRIPRENLLNSVADVSPNGEYLSAIKDPDQRFAAFMAPLTSGRVTIAASAVYISKIGLAIAIRYALSRRAFSISPNGPETLLLDYPSHQRRLLPLLAKTYAMSSATNYLKMIYVNRTPQSNKTIHVVSSALKAAHTWHNMRTLQECREACGGQGLKTENHVGHLKSEFDVQSTFEGDNNVLMQQVSKALLAEYIAAKMRNNSFKGLGLEHMNKPCPVIPSQLASSILRSSQFQMDAFCLRERDLLSRFALEVSQHQARGQSKEYAFILSYQLAEDLGRAFSDRLILQTFFETEATVSEGSLKHALGLLRSLYALKCLEEDAAFLRYGYLSTDNDAAVRKEVKQLCSEVRPHALTLVSSFGIPDGFLSPIAFNWIDANSWSSAHQ
ncbi:hypothetical protein Patl1_02375 [Pistacia atlantica]|uniref:Uncharacterized protein n=1 Tax=Pistacia atlantica TaxID=434234 RepID=A0ACC1CBQ9_9ROSI|nr:hypothetical protein Patl1_02375 [Pistacia atlantica]